MTVDVVTTTMIDRPCEVVALYAMNPDSAAEWYANIESVEWKTSPPLRVGSALTFVAHFLGRRLVYTYEIVELQERRHLVMRTAEGPFPMETTYEFEAVGSDRTKMTLRNRGEPSGFARYYGPIMAWAMRRANRQDLACLKTLLERPDSA